MSNSPSRAQMLQHIEELEDQLSKSQLVNPKLKNSERDSWAGSTWSEENNDTKSAPGGTDWNPPKTKVFKNIDEMSEDEILRHLEMRKSGLPNPIAAEAEILDTVPGVEKGICPQCNGTQRDVMTKSCCDQCNGFGYVWMVNDTKSVQMIKSIEAKWNVSKAKPQPQGVHEPGGTGDANPAPDKPDPDKKPEKVPPATSSVSKAQELQVALNKAQESLKDLLEVEEEAMEGENDDDKKKEAIEMEGEETEKCKKSLEGEILARSMQLALSSVSSLASQVEEVVKSLEWMRNNQGEQAQLLHSLSLSHMDVAKSLSGNAGSNSETANDPRPARAPKAAGPGDITVLQKGFVDNAPGRDITDASEGGYQSRFDLPTLKKGTTKMILAGKLDRRHGTRLEVGTFPEEKILKSIERFIDEHGVDDE